MLFGHGFRRPVCCTLLTCGAGAAAAGGVAIALGLAGAEPVAGRKLMGSWEIPAPDASAGGLPDAKLLLLGFQPCPFNVSEGAMSPLRACFTVRAILFQTLLAAASGLIFAACCDRSEDLTLTESPSPEPAIRRKQEMKHDSLCVMGCSLAARPAERLANDPHGTAVQLTSWGCQCLRSNADGEADWPLCSGNCFCLPSKLSGCKCWDVICN